MVKPLLFLACLVLFVNFSFAQEYNPKKAYTIGTDTFHFNQPYTVKLIKSQYSCDEYRSLYKELKNQQFKVYQYATNLADSLSQVEYPCFEYEATFGCVTELRQKANKLINPTEDCVIMREPHSEPCYEYSINITKKRRSKIKLSTDESTVFCPEDLIRE